MAEELKVDINAKKPAKYQELLPQLEALLQGENDLVANLANTAAALKQTFGFFWVGFYFVKNDMLVLGPFQGPVACTRIARGKGVCGACWQEGRTVIVPDVNAFPGHIACNGQSKSEIVVPVIHNGKVVAMLDIDSDRLDDFDEIDQKFLEMITGIVAQKWDTMMIR